MLEVRIHGRGGQGAVTAARILVNAALKEGLWGQTIPQFGGERRGAPVKVSLRLSPSYIPIRTHVHKPDLIMVMDASLFDIVELTKGLNKNGTIVINTTDPTKLEYFLQGFKVFSVNATRMAEKELGSPIVNTAMLGAFCKATDILTIGSVREAVKEWFEEDDLGGNVKLVKKAYRETVKGVREK